jgi:hypothetical protein
MTLSLVQFQPKNRPSNNKKSPIKQLKSPISNNKKNRPSNSNKIAHQQQQNRPSNNKENRPSARKASSHEASSSVGSMAIDKKLSHGPTAKLDRSSCFFLLSSSSSSSSSSCAMPRHGLPRWPPSGKQAE